MSGQEHTAGVATAGTHDKVAMEEKLGLEYLNLGNVDLSNVNAGKLARAVVRIKEVFLSGTRLTTDQLNVIFQGIIGEENMDFGLRRRICEETFNLTAAEQHM